MPLIIKIDPIHPDPAVVQETIAILKSGGIIAYPTETFYGLGADACNETALERIFSAKGRDYRNPIPVIIEDRGSLSKWVLNIPDTAAALMDRFWPGPLTLVFQASAAVAARVSAGTGKIGIRVSSSRIASELAGSLACPLTATSANLSGHPECTRSEEVYRQLKDRIDAIVEGGPAQGGKGSTIVDVTYGPVKVLREGAVPLSLIRQVVEDLQPAQA